MTQRPRRAMVMAMDRNKLIGCDGGLPWHIPADFKHFKATTLNKAIIMGRRTFSEDIKRALPNRTNIVVTRNPLWSCDGVDVVFSLEHAFNLADQLLPNAEEHYVIGGAQLCCDAIDSTERIYLTVVEGEFEGDTWFTSFDFSHWRVIEKKSLEIGPENKWPVTFYTLDRA